jgi:diguanylate cyclase (GGDEF)-like protein
LLIDNVSMEEAVLQARELREEVEKHRFTEHDIASTVSIGVAAYPQNGRTNDDLLQTARKAVFEAQRSGRNKVFYYLTEWYAHDAVLHEE